MKPRDYTKQENLIAKVLDNLGIRYVQQYQFGNRTVDVFIPDLKLVIEADGPYGHIRKEDRARDEELFESGEVDQILHVKESSAKEIKEKVENKIFSETYDCLG